MNDKISSKALFLVDGSSFLYRAYYGLRPLHTSKGVAVHAVYGFCRMIKKLIDMYDVNHIVLVWDKGKSDRKEFYPEYKASRQAAPSDIFEQKEYIIKFANLVGIEQLDKSGAEADDLMYSLAKKANVSGYQAVIVSSDKDMRQAIDDQIITLDPFRDTIMDVAACEERYGFKVGKLPFFFALLGDSSDNIPGVKGIGEKGATALVKQFDSLQGMYDNLDKIEKDRTRKLLEDGKEKAFLSQKLFLLKIYDITTSLDDITFNESDWKHALPLFQELEFKSLVKEIEGITGQKATPLKKISKNLHEKYVFNLVVSEDQLQGLCNQLNKVRTFALDTETTGLDPMQSDLIGISISYKEGEAFYIPFGHKIETQQSLLQVKNSTNDQQLDKGVVYKYLQPIFENSDIKKYLHNAKYDQLVLWQAGIKLVGIDFDTLIAASLIMKDWEKKGLKELSEQLFEESMLTYQDMVKKHKASDFSYVSIQDATQYAAADAHQTLKLYNYFNQELKKEKLENLFRNIELPTNDVLVDMQHEGIYCDSTELEKLDVKISKDLENIERAIADLVGKTINLNSPKQVKELLFNDLGLQPQDKSQSTNAQVLQRLSEGHVVPSMILKYRELFKLKSTYVEALPTYINSTTGRIHTSWNQALVATGRLSSSNPNLQNIPKDSKEYGAEIRAAFKSRDNWQFISADYSQIELRVLAQFSKDKNLIDAFLQNKDIHAQTAAKIFDIDENDVTSDQRNIGKRLNFSILYGLTPYGLSRDLKIPFAEAKKYIEVYFEQYPGVAKWMDDIVEFAKKHSYVETMYGRRRYVPGIYEKNKTLFDLARRIAINTPAQGTSAEVTKLGMIAFQKNVQKNGLKARILLQIHDELLVSCPEEELETIERMLKSSLEEVVSWDIPLFVSTKTGKNWRDVTK